VREGKGRAGSDLRFIEKSKAAYNKKADHYDQTPDGRFTRRFKQLILAGVHLRDGMSVLDVACGNGSLLAAMQKKARIEGFGIDISEGMVDAAARKNPGMTFHVSGCEEMPFTDASMDLITVSAAYHHFPDVVAFADEVARLLKPGGVICIADIYLPAPLRVLVNPLLPFSRSGDVRIHSPEEIAQNFKRLGVVPVRLVRNRQIQVVTMRERDS